MEGGNQRKHRMKEISHTLRAICSYPTREALAGTINGVAGAIVGTEADLSAGSSIPATWTHCKYKRSFLENNFNLHIITDMQRLVKSIFFHPSNIMTPNLDTLLWEHLHKQIHCVKGCVNNPLMDCIVLFEWT